MFKVKDTSPNVLKEMGFKKNTTGDLVLRRQVDGGFRNIFTIYLGSDYLRFSRTGYVVEEALRCVYEWTKKDYIEWED